MRYARFISRGIIFTFFFFFPQQVWLQGVNLGTPPVLNFSRQDYKAGTQIWDISQDQHGVLWYANNSGLLEYDGTYWRLYPLENGTIVRSVQAGADGRVYVGGQGDFGYFSPDQQGRMQYHSLKNLLRKSDQNFGDVWDIEVRTEGVFFRTDDQVYWFHDDLITTLFPTGKTLFFMGKWGDKLLVQDSKSLLFVFEKDHFNLLQHPQAFDKGRISAVLALQGDTILVTTIRDGIFFSTGGDFQPWHTADDAFLKNNRIFCAALLPDGKIALGTSLNGLIALDRQRRILHHLNKKCGLQNNTVLSLFALKNGSVWLGLDNGLDFVELHSPFSTFFPDGDLQGTGYTAQLFRDKIYFGTNTGLFATAWKKYYAPSEKQHFSTVANAEGQVWSLNVVDNHLLMGHHEGAFDVEGLTALKLTSQQGIWRFVQIGPDQAVAGHYAGLSTFKKTSSKWVFDQTLQGFTESSRIMARDERGTLWMAHPYRGIYRLKIDEKNGKSSADYFGAAQGLPSDMGNHLFKLGDKIVFTGEKGVFDFDETRQRFVPNTQFTQLFGENTALKYLLQDDHGNIWYVTNQETGVLFVENNTLEKKIKRMPIPELQGKLTDGFHFILPVDNNNVFVATGQGFIHFNPEAYKSLDTTLQLVLHAVWLKGQTDSLLFGGKGALPKPLVLSSLQNSLVIAYSAPDYPGGEFVQYAHYLEGIERDWSNWNRETDVTFNHLRPGEYTFYVKARNQHGVVSMVQSFSFTILPPWYASRWAFIIYLLLTVALIAGLIHRQQQRFEHEKQSLQSLHQHREAQHQLQAQRAEEAINQLKNEKLEAEIFHKNQELTSVTMHLVQKNAILSNIQGALGKLQTKMVTMPDLEKEIGRIVKMMEHDARVDDDWEHFSQNFDQVHSDFLKRLSDKYDHLSPNDYRLCAYLRMNLSSKEIATLMNISLRGVEASRYRLRRRLNLDTEINLTDYLIRF
jgi:ligand-binding sensor domain-containing protein/DNA-binding CsgD family transcriptional regulator